MSSAVWFQRAKAAIALVEWLETPTSGRSPWKLAITRQLLDEYRRATRELGLRHTEAANATLKAAKRK